MPADPVDAPQLHLFASHSPTYQDALARYEAIRPILKRERTLPPDSTIIVPVSAYHRGSYTERDSRFKLSMP
jgi:hypothetical protein